MKKFYSCTQCNGFNVAVARWVNLNTGGVGEEASPDDVHCLDCDELVGVNYGQLVPGGYAPSPAGISIGDLAAFVGEPEGGNPYRNNRSLIGFARRDALLAFRDGGDCSGFTFWHIPSSGPFRRVTDRNEVRWDTAGALSPEEGTR